MDNTIDSLQIEIESNFKSADNGINKLKNSIKKLVEINENLANMNSNSSIKIRELAASLEKLKSAGDGIGELANQLKSLSKLNLDNLSKGPERAAKLADAIKKTQDETLKNGTVNIKADIDTEKVQGKLSGLGMFLWPLASKFSWLGNIASSMFYKMGDDGEKEFTRLGMACNRFAEIMKQRYGSLGRTVKTTLKDMIKISLLAGKLASKPFASLGKGLSNMHKKVGGLVKSVARIGMYRVIRAALSAITNGIKEGVKNLYAYSQAVGGKFAPSLDKISTSFQYLKNSLGAMAAPLINAIAPAIDTLIDKFVSLINIINQLFARLTGASTWTKAIKGQKKFAAAAGGSAKAVKSLTMGFDELNILSKDSGGGGGGAAANMKDMFEEVKLDPNFMKDIDFTQIGVDFANKLNTALDNFDAIGVGEKIASVLNSAFEVARGFVDTFNWSELGQKIADGLNGFIEVINATNIGETIANTLNGAVDVVRGFVDTLNWTDLGNKIADGINGIVDNFDLTNFGQTIINSITGVIEMINTTLANVKFFDIGKNLIDALGSLDFNDFGTKLGTFINNAVDAALNFVAGGLTSDKLAEIPKNIFTGLGNIIANIKWGDLIMKAVGIMVLTVVRIPELLLGAIEGLSLGLAEIFKALGLDGVAGFFEGIAEKIKDARTWLKEHLVDPVVNWVKDLFGIHSPSTVFMEIGTFLIEGLLKGISEIWKNITEFFGKAWEGLKKGFEDTWNGIKKKTTEIWNGIKDGITKTWDNIKKKAKETWDNMKKKIGDTWENVKTKTSTVWKNVKTDLGKVWDGFKTKVKDTWDNMKKKVGDTWENIKKSTGEKWGDVKDSLSKTWDYLKEHGDDFTGKIKGFVTDSWENIKKTSGETWEGVKSTVKGVWDEMTNNSDTIFSGLKTTICDAWSGIHDHISGVVNGIGGFFSDLVGNITSGVKDISRGFDDMSRDADRAAKNVNSAFNKVNTGGRGRSNGIRGWNAPTAYASGGYPKTGELFLAREAGAEMVGSIGGRTAVANNDQIVAGIYQGVLAAMNNSNKGNTDFDVKVYLDGKQVTSAVEKRQRERGANIYGGGVLNGI
jgi:phage-related protein